MLTAVAVVLQYIEISIPFVPSFIKLDISDLPELIGSFAISPTTGVVICLLKNLIHLPFGTSAGIGELSNFILGAVFVFTAGIIYKLKKTKSTAFIGCIAGAFAMSVVSIASNYFIVYPVYSNLWFGGNMNLIVDMYKLILPQSDTLLKSLLIFNLPFTFAKGIIDSVLAMIVYKPLSNLIVKMNNSFNKAKTKNIH